MSVIYVCGHQRPDNDAIMSSVILSQLLNATNDGNTYVPRRLGEVPPESAAMLKNWDIPMPEFLEEIKPAEEGQEPQKVILTDHNEAGQSIPGIENAQIVGVIDHHRIGDFSASNPIMFITMPWGSTCSIVWYLFKCYNIEPTLAQSCCLLSAMMTDMVMTKSPTTTDIDRGFIAEIGEKWGFDPFAFGLNIFMNRPTDLYTPKEMVAHDIKQFNVGDKLVYIGQYETVNKSRALGMLPELYKEMEAFRAEKGADTLALVITDIMEEGSQLLVVGDAQPVERGLNVTCCEEGVWLPGVLSRKKQLAAPILAAAE